MTKDSQKSKDKGYKKRGAKTKYREEYCEQLVEHMAKGFSFESFAATVDVDRDTIYEWAKVHPEFSDAKKRGIVKSLLRFEALALANMTNKNFNTTSWIYQMKCRFNQFGWNPVSADPYDAGDDFEFK